MGSSLATTVVFIAILVAYVVWRYVRCKQKLRRGQDVSAIYEVGCLFLALYLLYLLSSELLPVDFKTFGIWSGAPRFEWVPFATVAATLSDQGVTAGYKVLLIGEDLLRFAPLGILLPLLKDRFASYQSVVTVSLLFNLGIVVLNILETLFGIASRTVSTDSFIFALAGATIGWLIFLIVRTIMRRYYPDFRRIVPQMTADEEAELLADDDADWFEHDSSEKPAAPQEPAPSQDPVPPQTTDSDA